MSGESKSCSRFCCTTLRCRHRTGGAVYLKHIVSGSPRATAVNGLKSNPMTAILGGGALVGDLRDVITVTTNLPDLISTWGSTTKNFLKFARGNHVDTGDLASKI